MGSAGGFGAQAGDGRVVCAVLCVMSITMSLLTHSTCANMCGYASNEEKGKNSHPGQQVFPWPQLGCSSKDL